MGRACLGSIVLVVITVMAFIGLISINYAEGKPNEDENHSDYVPNVSAYTSTETTVKNFEKKENLTHQDSTLSEMADSEQEADEYELENYETFKNLYKGNRFDYASAEINSSEHDEIVHRCPQPSQLSTFQKSERELRLDIFRSYDKGARPVKKPSTPVNVSISVTPLVLISTNEGQIVLDTYTSMTWMDEYLLWDPCEYGGITELHMPVSDIWKPDVGLLSAIPDTSVFPVTNAPAIVYNSGKVVWTPQFTIRSRCPCLSKNISDSSVSCNIHMGSWTYSDNLLNLEANYGEIYTGCFEQHFNPDWELVSLFSSRQSYYEGTPDLTYYINYNVTLKSLKHD